MKNKFAGERLEGLRGSAERRSTSKIFASTHWYGQTPVEPRQTPRFNRNQRARNAGISAGVT
jgi:hypothetical protein